jgi:hypothetical protein
MHKFDCPGVIIAWSSDQVAPLEHFHNYFSTYRGSDDGQGPVTVFSNAAGRNVCVFGSEIRAVVAPFPSPCMAFLEIDFVVTAVMGPDLENALNICLLYCATVETVFLFKQFFEYRLVK